MRFIGAMSHGRIDCETRHVTARAVRLGPPVALDPNGSTQ